MSFENIIQLVQTRPEIWQLSHPLYHNKGLKKRIWRELSKELRTSEQLIRKRWKHLIDQYRKEFKKQQSQSTYQGVSVPSRWVHYTSLAFLKDEMVMRKERDRSRMIAGSESDTQDQDEGDSKMDNYENIVWTYDDNEPRAIKPETTTVPTATTISKADLILRRLQNISTAIANTSNRDGVQNDEDYLFFMSVLPMVRNLTPVKKLHLRMKINEWLLKTMTGEADPLNNVGPFEVPVDDDKDAVIKQILETDDIE